MNTTLEKVLHYLNIAEKAGLCFFSRLSNGDMMVNIRDPRLFGQSADGHWPLAYMIEDSIRLRGGKVSTIKFDGQSGTIALTVYSIYSEAA